MLLRSLLEALSITGWLGVIVYIRENNISTLVMPTLLKSFNEGHHQAFHSLLPFPFSSNVHIVIYTHTHTHTFSPFIMKVLQQLLALATGSLALTIPSTSDRKLLDRDAESDLMPRASCENSASDRSCWGDYSTDTNYYVRGVLSCFLYQ